MPLDFNITFDFSGIENLGDQPLWSVMWFFFMNGGWVLLLFVLVWGGLMLFQHFQEEKFGAKQNYIFLALDIPKINLQSPKAVENIFSVLAGAHMPLEWEEKFFAGKYQLGLSLEIVCIDGYIQFVIRTPVQWRELVEAAFYAQYPDAEITEVQDYTVDLELTFPNDEYEIWGCDMKHIADYWLPIKTYVEFEHPLSKDIKDPMISFLEVLNKMKTGEQFWYQILIFPTDVKWTKKGIKALKKLGGEDVADKKTLADKIIESPITALSIASEYLLGWGSAEEPKKEQKPKFFLPPIEKLQADGISRKLSKVGFKVKWRFVYLAKKEVFNKGLGVSATVGAFKQFIDMNLNGFKPDVNKTQVRWPWFNKHRLNKKKNAIFAAYKKRSDGTGAVPTILNTEELATLYHFPYIETYGAKVKKIESKKSKAPVGLPSEAIGLPIDIEPQASIDTVDKVPVINYDDDYFENRFAKDKTGQSDKLRKEQILQKLNLESSTMENPPEPQTLPAKKAEIDEFNQKYAKRLSQDNQTEKPRGQPPANLPFVK